MIDFTKLEGEVTYLPDGINIRIREIAVVAPAPPPPVVVEPPPVVVVPPPVVVPPSPARWSYPAIQADITCGPTDIVALIALLNASPARDTGGRTLRVTLLDGIYNFPATVYPKVKDCIFTAAHGANVIFNFNTSAGHGFYFTSVNAASNVMFKRIRFTDLRSEASSQGGFQLVKFDAGSYIDFVECEFDNSRASGVYGNSGATWLSFSACIIRDNGVSTQFDHGCYMHSSVGLLKFDTCFLVNNTSHGLHFYDGSTSDVEKIQNIRVINSVFLSYGEPQDRPILFQDATTPTTKVASCTVTECMFFNAHPTEDATEKDRNSVKFVNPSVCSFNNNLMWNVPLVTNAPLTAIGNTSIPPVKQGLHTQFATLDDTACRYVVSILNPGMLPIVSVIAPTANNMPAGRYAVHSVAAPIGTAPDFINYIPGQLIDFDMTRKYSRPQHRAGGFDFGTHRGANAFRLIRLPDTFV